MTPTPNGSAQEHIGTKRCNIAIYYLFQTNDFFLFKSIFRATEQSQSYSRQQGP